MRSREVRVTIQVDTSQMQAVLADIRQRVNLIRACVAVAQYPASRWLAERKEYTYAASAQSLRIGT